MTSQKAVIFVKNKLSIL